MCKKGGLSVLSSLANDLLDKSSKQFDCQLEISSSGLFFFCSFCSQDDEGDNLETCDGYISFSWCLCLAQWFPVSFSSGVSTMHLCKNPKKPCDFFGGG